MLNWSSASCLFDCTKNAPFFLDLRSIKYQVFFLIPVPSFFHSISICTVYSMHPLAWSKHYLCPPSWLRFECSSVAWESTTTLQLFGLDILIWLHNIIPSPAWPFSLDMCTQWVSVLSLYVEWMPWLQVTYILKTGRRQLYIVHYNVHCTLYMYCRICSFAVHSSHPVRKYISIKP
jgi:hypothetical protein